MFEFKLPDVGEGIHEAEVVQWLINEGDTVTLNQPILEIQTDKAIVEIPSPVAGTVAEIRASVGALAHVGDVMIVIAESGDRPIRPTSADTGRPAQPPAKGVSAGIAGPGQRVLAAPAVRKMALELGLNLAEVPGSGPAGRVLPDDLKRFAAAPKAEPARPDLPTASPPSVPVEAPSEPEAVALPVSPVPGPLGQEIVEEEPLQGLRRRIAERMEQAWQIPHVTSFDEIDVSKLITLRKALQPEAEQRGVHLTYLPFIIKAVVQALKENPYFNASLDMANQKIVHHRYYHLGVATAVEDGLLVPVVRHADRLSLIQLAVELKRLADLAQERRLTLPELSGSTFTITNFGSYGGRMGTPIINPPEVAILGTGRIDQRPVVIDGELAVQPTLPLALSFDHRLIDGAASGKFLRRIKALLSEPNLLFLELT